jgi:hypothetical protein
LAARKTGASDGLLIDWWSGMVLLDRIELSTSSLPMKCSTTELQQRLKALGPESGAGGG